jgi:hypothetical protein
MAEREIDQAETSSLVNMDQIIHAPARLRDAQEPDASCVGETTGMAFDVSSKVRNCSALSF